MKHIEGNITAPQGFLAAGIHCGIRHNRSKRDLALIYAETPCSAAAVYTKNLVKGAPLVVTARHLQNGTARAVVCNSGNANTCNADGEEKAERMCALAADALHIQADEVLVASTGVIGQTLDMAPIEQGMPDLAAVLTHEGGSDAEEAIMTTDTREKEIAVEFSLGGSVCRLGGIAKGSGMIHPNMATMLCFLTTDAAVSATALKAALGHIVPLTFNMVSVDRDTSTNDMAVLMASGCADNEEIADENAEGFETFAAALLEVCTYLAREIARDGEGASKLLECRVTGAATDADARALAKSVICSNLLKAAMFGADANWGRVLCALGYAGAAFDPARADVSFRSENGAVEVCKAGAGIPFSEELAARVLRSGEIGIDIAVHMGDAAAVAWGCDLTYDYVKINGDYRT